MNGYGAALGITGRIALARLTDVAKPPSSSSNSSSLLEREIRYTTPSFLLLIATFWTEFWTFRGGTGLRQEISSVAAPLSFPSSRWPPERKALPPAVDILLRFEADLS